MRWPVGHTIIHEDHESPVTPRATTLDLNDEPEIGEASAEVSLQCHVSNTLMIYYNIQSLRMLTPTWVM